MTDNPLIRLIDDDKNLSDAMRFMLMSEGWESIYYESAEEFLKRDDFSRPGCIVLDYQMPGINGAELQEIIRKKNINLPIIFLTAHADVDFAINVFRNGAKNILKKPVDPLTFLSAVAEVIEKSKNEASSDEYNQKFSELTKRERQVLLMVSSGLMNCQIASRLELSERTIEAHRASGYRRLGVKTLSELNRFLFHIDSKFKK